MKPAATVLLLLTFFLTGCQLGKWGAHRITELPPNPQQLVGRHIEAEGVVTNTKMPSIAGIQVESLGPYAGKKVRVRGVLRTYTITQKYLDDAAGKGGGPVASIGPGTYYYLRPLTYELLD